jgi:hypothetical protein
MDLCDKVDIIPETNVASRYYLGIAFSSGFNQTVLQQISFTILKMISQGEVKKKMKSKKNLKLIFLLKRYKICGINM